MLEKSFNYDDVDLIIKMKKEFFYGGFIYDVEIPQEKLLKFLNENNEIFKSIANEYALKIRTNLKNQ